MTPAEPAPEPDVVPATRKPSLSPSRANDFMQCPLLFRFRVVDRLPEEPSRAAVRGTLVHAVLERLFDAPAPERTTTAARDLLGPCWSQMQVARPDCVDVIAADGGTDLLFGEAGALLDTYFGVEDPTRLEPAERELDIRTPLDDELDLRGIVDRLDVAADGAMRVVDYKTGRSPTPGFEGSALFQMRFYALALTRARGRVPSMLQLVYLGDGTVLRHVPTTAELETTEKRIRAVWSGIRAAARSGQWQPRRSALCSWCSHQALCPEFGGQPPALDPEDAERALGIAPDRLSPGSRSSPRP